MDIIYQYAGWGTRALEVALAAVFLVHGWNKIQNPTPVGKLFGRGKSVGLLFGLVEVVAAVMVATEIGTFFGSLAMIVIMLGAIFFKLFKWKTPFVATDAPGWELDLVILAGALTLLIG